MIYGLLAALGWGLADFSAAMISRRMGSFSTVLVAQGAGAVAFALLWATGTVHAGDPSARDLLALAGVGVLYAFTYWSFYRALELGPIALVSPVVASYAAIVIVLALLLLDESLRGIVLAGIAVTLVGVLLVSTDLRAVVSGAVRQRGGVPFGLLAMVGFGITAYSFGFYAKRLGWFLPVLVGKAVMSATLFAMLPLRRERRPAGSGLAMLGAAVGVGLLDNVAFFAYTRGAELGLLSIVAAASAVYPLVPAFGGVALLGERFARHQLAGVALVIAGLLLLAFRQ